MELYKIQFIVENYFGYKINVKSRRRRLVDARKIYFGLCREFTRSGLFEIGKSLNRDHATALHNIRSCKDLRQTDPDFNRKYLDLYKQVNSLKANNWIPKKIIIPKVIHPGVFMYGTKESIRKIFDKRRSTSKQRNVLY
ncbi:chromosomal replication initiation protein [uncultured Mediterranean phage uvMED]|nr:chromosomal replication initiation protein [uncultured Mediterranean phage uvMED]